MYTDVVLFFFSIISEYARKKLPHVRESKTVLDSGFHAVGSGFHNYHHHHHHQSLFIHEIVSFYMVFLGIVFKTRLKYSKELLTIMLKIQKLLDYTSFFSETLILHSNC